MLDRSGASRRQRSHKTGLCSSTAEASPQENSGTPHGAPGKKPWWKANAGAAIMATISAGGSHLGWENSSQRIITGVIIIVAVAVDQLRHRKAMASQGD